MIFMQTWLFHDRSCKVWTNGIQQDSRHEGRQPITPNSRLAIDQNLKHVLFLQHIFSYGLRNTSDNKLKDCAHTVSSFGTPLAAAIFWKSTCWSLIGYDQILTTSSNVHSIDIPQDLPACSAQRTRIMTPTSFQRTKVYLWKRPSDFLNSSAGSLDCHLPAKVDKYITNRCINAHSTLSWLWRQLQVKTLIQYFDQSTGRRSSRRWSSWRLSFCRSH